MCGFHSAVVPTFAAPPTDPGAWGWWTFTTDWMAVPAPRLDPTAGPTRSVVFDGDGVRDN